MVQQFNSSINCPHVVWFKRDLRLTDHVPLSTAIQAAQQSGQPLILLYLFEPALLTLPDSAPQHALFALECLENLAEQLPQWVSLWVVVDDAIPFFERLTALFGRLTVYSHQETGNWASFERDKALKRQFKSAGLVWREWQSNAVIRGRLNRDEWSKLWLEAMAPEPLQAPHWAGLDTRWQRIGQAQLEHSLESSSILHMALNSDYSKRLVHFKLKPWFPHLQDKPHRQRGGRHLAEQVLKQFLEHTARNYRFEMSSPLSAPSSCSRISPYLAWGVMSVREVGHRLQAARLSLAERVPPGDMAAWKKSFQSFEARLHWHCHFIQKLETEPELEWRAAHRGLDAMRNAQALTEEEQRKLQAWAQGKTGFPMIDACMRMLHHTGWVNFRMRAMLVAFASYQLWLDWRHTAPVLAREFLDYEPGIHYPQFQMQSGVTGINTLRIYNPVKQAKDQDPEGLFIRHWIPELQQVPNEWLAEPWAMPALIAQDVGYVSGSTYAAPIVNPALAISEARKKLTLFRQQHADALESARVYAKHGSRNPNRNGRPRTRRKKELTPIAPENTGSDQLSLF